MAYMVSHSLVLLYLKIQKLLDPLTAARADEFFVIHYILIT